MPETVRHAGAGDERWFEGWRPRGRPALRLFCLPYAGGSALAYRGWQERLPASIEVCPVQLPGHGKRMREPLHTDAASLVDVTATALAPYADVPFALFGHSMGAVLAFEIARTLRARHQREAVHLFVSGRRAPHLLDTDPPAYALPDAEFLASVRALNGAPPELFDHEELMSLMLPVLRADFKVSQEYRQFAGEPLRCPIRVFGGVGDRGATRDMLQAWQQHTTGATHVSLLPGDHFFIYTAMNQVLYRLALDVRAWVT